MLEWIQGVHRSWPWAPRSWTRTPPVPPTLARLWQPTGHGSTSVGPTVDTYGFQSCVFISRRTSRTTFPANCSSRTKCARSCAGWHVIWTFWTPRQVSKLPSVMFRILYRSIDWSILNAVIGMGEHSTIFSQNHHRSFVQIRRFLRHRRSDPRLSVVVGGEFGGWWKRRSVASGVHVPRIGLECCRAGRTGRDISARPVSITSWGSLGSWGPPSPYPRHSNRHTWSALFRFGNYSGSFRFRFETFRFIPVPVRVIPVPVRIPVPVIFGVIETPPFFEKKSINFQRSIFYCKSLHFLTLFWLEKWQISVQQSYFSARSFSKFSKNEDKNAYFK